MSFTGYYHYHVHILMGYQENALYVIKKLLLLRTYIDELPRECSSTHIVITDLKGLYVSTEPVI